MELQFKPMPDDDKWSSGGFESTLGSYFETFYLPLYGPSSVTLMRFLARQLQDRDEYLVDDRDLGMFVGLHGARDAATKAPTIMRALARLEKLGMVDCNLQLIKWRVRTRIRTLSSSQAQRLPPELLERHVELMAALAAS